MDKQIITKKNGGEAEWSEDNMTLNVNNSQEFKEKEFDSKK